MNKRSERKTRERRKMESSLLRIEKDSAGGTRMIKPKRSCEVEVDEKSEPSD